MSSYVVGDKVRDIHTGEIGTIVSIGVGLFFPVLVSTDLDTVPLGFGYDMYMSMYFASGELIPYSYGEIEPVEEKTENE